MLKIMKKIIYLFYIVSVASQNAADENDMNTARSRGRAALYVNVAGISCSVVTVIIVVVISLTSGVTASSYYNDYYYGK